DQSQACEQSMVEAEKDFKKMIGHMSEPHETMEVRFALMSVLKAFSLRIDQEYSTGRVYLRHRRVNERSRRSMTLAQSQTCEQSMVEAEKDFKKMIGHMSEPHETMEKHKPELLDDPLCSCINLIVALRIDQEYSTGRVYLRHRRIIAVHLNDVALGRENMYKRNKGKEVKMAKSCILMKV
nr:hypothetical protein [Tanacetum cinerariifolium]